MQAQLLQAQLQKYDFASEIITDFEQACSDIESGMDADVILLDYDLGSDDGDGVDLCRRIEQASDTPIVVMTGNHTARVVVEFLNAGATQFIFKPYRIDSLIERINEAMNAIGLQYARDLKGNNAERPILDFNLKTASFYGKVVPMTEKELELFELLLADEGRTVYRDDINFLLNGDPRKTRYADVLITKLRRKLALLPGGFRVRSIRGLGYCLLRRGVEHHYTGHTGQADVVPGRLADAI